MYDAVIIGSGPSGLTAAIYSGRARFRTVVIAGVEWGGQLMLTAEIENFPGFKGGVLGPDLMDNMWKQAEDFGVEFRFDDATQVDFSTTPFRISAGDSLIEGRAVIIATGASPRWLGVEGEKRLMGKGVSSCATCDAAFFEGKKVVVVGGGDSAMEEALALTKFTPEVKVVHRRRGLRASKILQERALGNDRIDFIWNSSVLEILGEEKVEGLRVIDNESHDENTIEADGVFIAIGHIPNTEIFRDQVELDDGGYVVADGSGRTSMKGIFVAGDASDSRYRQAITAAGAGCKAALEVERYLLEDD